MAKLVEVKGLDEIHQYLQNLPAKLEGRIVRGGLKVGAQTLADKARQYAPSKTGALRRSIKVTSSVKKGVATSTVVSGDKSAWYGHIMEFGSGSHYAGGLKKSKRKPYKIEARRKESLSINGKRVKSVIHPGVEPRRFMRDALDKGSAAAIEAAAEYMRKRIAKEDLRK